MLVPNQIPNFLGNHRNAKCLHYRKESDDIVEEEDTVGLSMTEEQSLLDAEDLVYYIKGPSSVFQSINNFKKWKIHCKEQYWYYKTWFFDWYFYNESCYQHQKNSSEYTISCLENMTVTPCTDGEGTSSNSENAPHSDHAGHTTSKINTNNKRSSFLNANSSDDDDDDNDNNLNKYQAVKLKKEHEFDLDEIAQDVPFVDNDVTDQDFIGNINKYSSNNSKEIGVKDVSFPTVCSAMGYAFNDTGIFS